MNRIRIAVLTDVHGNLPALEAVIEDIEKKQCDYIYNLGDAIALGPYPQECLEKILAMKNAQMLMGNHEQYFAFGITDEQRSSMWGDEILHQQWVHEHIAPCFKAVVAQFPYQIQEQFFHRKVCFLHYGLLEDGIHFKSIIDQPTYAQLDEVFKEIQCDVIFYGHHHPHYEIKGKRHFINPGSLGCTKVAKARYTIAEFRKETYRIEHIAVHYDRQQVFQAFEQREVPGRNFITEVFFGK